MNHVIEPAAGGAVGKEYMVMVNIAEGGKPGGDFSSIGGHYEDAYVKTAAGWRFKRRQFVPMKSTRELPQSAAVPSTTRASAGSASAPPAGGSVLAADDYLAIRALANTYASYGLDTGADKGGLYASVFTEDAEFHGPPAVPGGKPFDAKGRDALRQFALVNRGSAYVRHFMTNHLIEPLQRALAAKSICSVIDIAQGDKPTSINMGGHYEDVYVTDGRGMADQEPELLPIEKCADAQDRNRCRLRAAEDNQSRREQDRHKRLPGRRAPTVAAPGRLALVARPWRPHLSDRGTS